MMSLQEIRGSVGIGEMPPSNGIVVRSGRPVIRRTHRPSCPFNGAHVELCIILPEFDLVKLRENFVSAWDL